MKKIKKALISVSDKSNLKELLTILSKFKVEIISSGGTYKQIKKLGYKCTEVSKYTNFPEILDGRLKTLHPKIHGGILSKRNNKKHLKDLKKNKIEEIDLVVVNFYPFNKILLKSRNHQKIIENIDIGGPSLTRAAAKNYEYVTVISSIKNYKDIRWALGSLYFKGKVIKMLPNKNILLDIRNVSENLLHLIGYIKINNLVVKVSFLEKIAIYIFRRKKSVYYFDYCFLDKFKISEFNLRDILVFLGFTKIAGTSNVSYWIKKKINNYKSTYDKDNPFYILKKLQ